MKKSFLAGFALAMMAIGPVNAAPFSSAVNPSIGCPTADSGEVAFCALATTLIGAGHQEVNWGAFAFSGIATTATLRFEESAFANGSVLGLWWANYNDTSTVQRRDVFMGNAGLPNGSGATLDTFSNPGLLTITGFGTGVQGGTVSGFNPNFFGLFLRNPNGEIIYSLAELNAGGTNRFGLRTNGGPTGTAVYGFDDNGNTARIDVNDAAGTLESFSLGTPPAAVPEPLTSSLCGAGLLALAAFRRRK